MGMTIAFEAVKGIQAGKPYYTTMVKYSKAIELFNFIEEDEEIPVELRSQRKVSSLRVKKITDYIMNRPSSYILPALTAEVYSDMEFIPVVEGSDIGELVIELEDDTKIGLTDGQHRLLGVKQLLTVDKTKADETFSITIYKYEGLRLSQQRFSDINSKAKTVSKNLTIAYNDDDAVSKLTNSFFAKPEQLRFKMLVELEKNSPSKNKLFSIKDFYNANLMMMQKLKQLEIPYTFQQGLIYRYWDNIFKLMPIWLDKKDYVKKDTIASHAIMIKALGILFNKLIDSKEFKQKMQANNNLKFVDDYYKEKLDDLSEIDFSKANPEIINICYFNGKLVRNNAVMSQLADYIGDSLGTIKEKQKQLNLL